MEAIRTQIGALRTLQQGRIFCALEGFYPHYAQYLEILLVTLALTSNFYYTR